MKFTLGLPGLILYPGRVEHWSARLHPSHLLTVAQRADVLGIDYLRFSEHIVMHPTLVPAMGARWSHGISSAAWVAGATHRIGLLTLVVVPYHEPLDLAKSLATVDFLSEGRLSIIGGAGYMEWEFDAIGQPYHRRRELMDEYLAAMIELWTADEPVFDGETVSFRDVVFEPKPAQAPHPPLLLGGYSKSALRRIAELGDGWILQQTTTRGEIPAALEYIRAQPGFLRRPRKLEVGTSLWEGRVDPRSHEVIEPAQPVYEADAILEQVSELAALGVTIVGADGALRPPPPEAAPHDALAHHLEQIEWFAAEVLPHARGITSAHV